MRGLRALAFPLIGGLAVIAGAAMLEGRATAEGAPPPPPAPSPIKCTALPGKLLGGPIKFVSSQLVPANAPAVVNPLPNSLPAGATFTGTNPAVNSGPPANTPITVPVKYCLVVLSYSSTPPNDPTPQNITIYVGLPLNSTDGGATGSTVNDPPFDFRTVQGNWNGRTEGQGGGGCTGNNNVNSAGAVANGFVGSGTDGGHGNPTDDPGNTCDQGVRSLDHLNYQYIEDWVYNGPQQEILWSKAVARLYYGRPPLFNYWNGCSTGGHQGYALAQSLPGELQGILASAPAMYWTRFQTAQMWGQIAMLDIADEVISGSKLQAVQQAAILACDDNDGVKDGIIDDPRTCTFNANANLCSGPPNGTCLSAAEVEAVNTMWDGPRNENGVRIWFPIDRGTDFCALGSLGWDCDVPFSLAPVQFGWDLENPAYYTAGSYPGSYPGIWGNVALNQSVQHGSQPMGDKIPYVTNYAAVAQEGSNNVADLTDTFGNLDAFRATGAKMVTFVGGNDQLIMPRGVINYYRTMAQRYQLRNDRTGFDGVQQFYRLFHVPGTGHCGLPIFSNGGSLGPWPQNGADFDAVINWVENGIAPSEVVGAGNQAGGAPGTLTRPTCPYPQTAVYSGNGSVTSAANWSCGGNLEKNIPVGTPLSGPPGLPVPCYDALAEYKHEATATSPDYVDSGINPAECH
jgi:hypothetical protein